MLLADVSISKEDFLPACFIAVNAISWAYLTIPLIGEALRVTNLTAFEENLVLVAYFSSLVTSNLLGGAFLRRVRRLHLLYLWTAIGGLITLVPIVIQPFSLNSLIIFSLSIGSSIGIGLPSCLTYLANVTRIEERGRVSAAFLLISYLTFPILNLIAGPFGLTGYCLIFGVWRLCGLLVWLLNPKEPRIKSAKKNRRVFHARSFIAYMIPWILFCLVDNVTSPLLESGTQVFLPNFYLIIQLLGGVFCVLAGVSSDIVGRKRTLIVAFVAIGLGYAAVGFFPSLQASWAFFAVMFGAGWGSLTLLFMLVLWADLAPIELREKCFSIGVLPILVEGAITRSLQPVFSPFPVTSVFSLASFFLFLAVIPLLYAPETLPERIVERRRMRSYIGKAKKLREKLS